MKTKRILPALLALLLALALCACQGNSVWGNERLLVASKAEGTARVAADGSFSLTAPDAFRDVTDTNDFSHVDYPDAPTVNRLLGRLASERFTLVVQLKPSAIGGNRLTLLGASATDGLASPAGARALKNKVGQVTGWTVPFVYGEEFPVFLLRSATAGRLKRDWRNVVWQINQDAEKLTPETRENFISVRLAHELPGFIHSVRIELAMPAPEPLPAPAMKDATAAPQKRESKLNDPKFRLKGASGDIRRFRGPGR